MDLRKMWVNKKIISISNGFQVDPSDDSLNIGTIVDLVQITQSQNLIPIVKFEDATEPVYAFSTLLEYEPALYESLKKLTPKERYDFVMAFCNRFQDHRM